MEKKGKELLDLVKGLASLREKATKEATLGQNIKTTNEETREEIKSNIAKTEESVLGKTDKSEETIIVVNPLIPLFSQATRERILAGRTQQKGTSVDNKYEIGR